MSGRIKHKSQMSEVDKVFFQQHIEDCLLAIIATQKAPVRIPLEEVEAIAGKSRLVIEHDPESRTVTLRAEAAEIVIQPPNRSRRRAQEAVGRKIIN